MSETEEVLRIAAKGDGVTASGRHVPMTAPGDTVAPDGAVTPGPHHATPPCRHFRKCGGCQLQQLDEDSWTAFVRDRVANAAAGQGLEPAEFLPPHLSPPNSRRRATLHLEARGKSARMGFREGRSHAIVDMAECPVMATDLFAMVAPLRNLFAKFARKRLAADIHLTLADQGVDCNVKGFTPDGLAETEALIDFAQAHGLARLTMDDGYGPETHWEPDPVTVTLGGVPVSLPPGSFLQPTQEGEAALIADAREWLAGAKTVADLFSGLGTFAFALSDGAKVLAAEAARDAHLACKGAAGTAQRQVFAQHRDLFRNPLLPADLGKFDAVLLDPPRAGAKEQVARLAESTVPRICYISCNPASWAKDAATLVAAGYRLEKLRPVGQFRWSTHVELASLFVRES
ncbi:class I SAM-dependent RNA methyltransferase [Croceicoccus naphthovorans]|uniref:RNA methyltransferase n=1 Tax=Croceicoccus naphthovorans TaxID=1348774 RepID=A0A0G3XFW3_9SPHN|nr:class I SAM-dependent RNA methyltransferase [Croceicoccus naphthovorans]AKM10435.1 RNA methyltransferase [Croceicoccus naphthovorans]MBB3990147.1 23S rRNA (uracil1939-C5)-methyltransferase [Croceicoccus naphthovorans]